MAAPKGNSNATGNPGGKSLQERALAARVRSLALKQIEVVLKGEFPDDEDQEFYKAVLLKLAGTVLPRLNEVTGEGGEATDTHKPIAHHQFVENVVQALAYRKITITRDEYGVTPDGMKLFGFIQTDIERNGVALGIGLRNANDRSFTLGLVAGFRTFVCDNTSFVGEFQVIAKKHTKHLNIEDAVATGIDRVQRRFEPMLDRIDAWRNHSLLDGSAREIIYRAFIADELAAPKHLARVIHKNYFEPELEEFKPRTMFSLHSAFTSAFKTLDAMPGYRATADFAAFIDQVGN